MARVRVALRHAAVMAQARGRVITQRKLLAEMWGSEFIDHAHYLRIYYDQPAQQNRKQPPLIRVIS